MLFALCVILFLLFGAAIDRQTAAILAAEHRLAAGAGAVLLALDIVLPVPSSVVATAMGAMLGGWAGTLVNAAGLTAGCLLGLWLGRAGTPAARRILGAQGYADFDRWVARHGVFAVILCRAVPVLAEASIVALGASGGRRWPLIVAAALADIGLGAVYAFAGATSGPGAAPAPPALAAAIGVPALAMLLVLVWVRRDPGRQRPPAGACPSAAPTPPDG
ncbi:TVP38/TMEM64 family protein [Sphingomonas pokkalii]|nr:VTT domain-containing protein [Sphingomonas pokkalii]